MVNYARYRLGLASGSYRRKTPRQIYETGKYPSNLSLDLFDPPLRENLIYWLDEEHSNCLREADQVVDGHGSIFGGRIVPLKFEAGDRSIHWTEFERGKASLKNCEDIKFLWEPARFDWVATLARAYRRSGNERYPEAFWTYCEGFIENNPPYMGVQWMSGQEIALRLINLILGFQAFSHSPWMTEERRSWAAWLVEVHAQRILLTLPYALSQRNNHLISEAAGLISAARIFPASPHSSLWEQTGWKFFCQALEDQISPTGTYIQHSTNYLRLVLSLALWVNRISRPGAISTAAWQRLGTATQWLYNLSDDFRGGVPNLGSNDGAFLFPLTDCPFSDYRPVLQVAASVFLHQRAFADGPWNEMEEWFAPEKVHRETMRRTVNPDMPRIDLQSSWGTLRCAEYASRPGHADQLSVDLWWKGSNVVVDAGTYLYNAPPPWQNSLAGTDVHNTIQVDGQDQMLRAGKFLWLDWAQAKEIDRRSDPVGKWVSFSAQHNGYRRLGVTHRREMAALNATTWIIRDDLIPNTRQASTLVHEITINWLLADGEWHWEGDTLSIFYSEGKLTLSILQQDGKIGNVSLVRSGLSLLGDLTPPPYWGWFSPSYGLKKPALQFLLTWKTSLPFSIETSIHLSDLE